MSNSEQPTSGQPTSARVARVDLRARAVDLLRRDAKLAIPEALPIAERRDDLVAAIQGNQVVIVAGETGSGKSTQLPKLCIDAGRGVAGLIGHTQPRRVAARSIAERVADELGTELGTAVGYTVRFNDRVSDGTIVRVMTDGILLAEIQRDRNLSRYDTLIIDEAHERSLNIDFLLGYIKQLLPRRPDLSLIVTSATIDTARFSEHFSDAPIVEVAGRTYPVELRYRPLDEFDDRDQVQAVCDAVDELAHEGPGDVLVFLSGEREIHDTADALRRLELRHTQVLPLYARLSASEQHRIFEPHTGRRVVLSTNVAETSLTVPGVRYVVDAGAARISRYSSRLKVQRLPIEPVSQASANQRAGRCGRVAPGICIRLYGEDDFRSRPEYTEPEVLRTNLASVILQMTALGLGDVAAFPFLDPPDGRSIRDGVALLEELGALAPDLPADRRTLTALGRRLARLPIDPRLARMVLAAEQHGCAREVMIIAAALSIQDPRERPTDKQQAADESHRRFAVAGSDFLSLVKLWDHLREQQHELSSSAFRRLCRTEFLNYLRVREWQDLFRQLREAAAAVGIQAGTESGHPDRVHQALLAGLLSHLGMRDGDSREFRGARGSKFVLAPGSVVAKAPPKWVMAAELVETNRLWGRVAAAVQPEWAEPIAGHLIKRSYGEPHWDERGGRAVTSERVMLYGLPLVAARQVGYDKVDPLAAREIFIRSALVEGRWRTHHAFFDENRALVDEIAAMADRVRRWNLIDDDAIFGFYDRRIGSGVVSARHFDQWWKKERSSHPQLLRMTWADLAGADGALSASDYPDAWVQGDLVLPVSYRFEPGAVGDGVTVHVPLDVLNRLDSNGFDWQVPGFREELVNGLIRTLPKPLRRGLVPLADASRTAYAQLGYDNDNGNENENGNEDENDNGSITAALAPVVSVIAGDRIRPEDFDIKAVTDHLRITFSIEDDDGVRVAVGKDLDALRTLVGGRLRAIAQAAPSIERSNIERWDFGDLPEVIETERGGHLVRGYPALVDDGTSVSIRVFTRPEIQRPIMGGGIRRLLLLTVPVARRPLERELSNDALFAIGRSETMSRDDLLDDCITAAADALIRESGGPPWSEAGFIELQRTARAKLAARTASAVRGAGSVMTVADGIDARLEVLVAVPLRPSVDDVRAQVARLIRPGFVTACGVARLPDVLRYLRAVERRLEKLPEDPARDRRWMADVLPVEARYKQLLTQLAPSQITAEVVDVGWQIEELRVSLFAQTLGTPRPVSVRRIERELERLRGNA